MAYKLEELKIAPGGINLLPPGDQVAQGDSLELTGWWAGAIGKLQQAKGFTDVSGGGAGVAVDSVAESDGRIYYGGAGSLYQIGRGSIDSGYDTYPLGMVAYQGRMWIMNRSKQRKDDGANTYNWSPAPPTSAPTQGSIGAISAPTYTAGGTGTGNLLGPIHYIVTGVLTGHPTTEGECYRSAELLTTSANSAPEIGPTSAPDIAWVGYADLDSAVITPPTLPTHVTHYNVYRLIGPLRRVLDPSFPDSFYRVNRDPVAIASTYTDYGEDGGGHDDQSDNALIAANNTLFPGIDSAIYYVTGTNDLNEETSASPSLTATGGDAVLVTAPTFPDAQTTAWNVYRQSGGNPPYLVNPEPIPVAQTDYLDAGRNNLRYSGGSDQSDDGILSLGVLLHLGSSAAPAARVVAPDAYNGRLVVANSSTHPNRVWYSDSLKPSSFPGSASDQDGNWVDIGTDEGDAILAMSCKPGYMLFYRQRSVWRLVGDFTDSSARLEPLVKDMGIVGPRAVVSTSLGDFAMMCQGKAHALYKITDWATKLSTKVEPVLGGDSGPGNYTQMNIGSRSTVALGFQLGRLWVSYPTGVTTVNAATFILDIATDRWFSKSAGFSAYCNGSSYFLGAGFGGDGKVYSMEDGWTDAGGAGSLVYQSQFLNGGHPDREKTWGDLVVSHNLAGATMDVVVFTNNFANTSTDIITLDTTITSSALTRDIIPLVYPTGFVTTALRGKPIRARNISIRLITLSAPTASPGAEIDSPLIVHYYLEARKGRTFDTGITSHGLDGVGTIDMVELDVDTTDGAATLVISSDIPNGVMADRTSGGLAVPQTSGRQVIRLATASPINGRRFRHQISSSYGFQVYGYRVRILPIGVYADGSQSDLWVTGAIAAGV